jgi:hypothetical protein
MFNKKILAVAVAAAFSFNANAVIDLTDPTDALVYASQTIADGGTIDANAVFDSTVPTGFTLPSNIAGEEYYVRYELTNATFATSSLDDSALTNTSGGTHVIAMVAGGTAGTNFVVYTYRNDGTTNIADTFDLDMATTTTDIDVISVAAPVVLTYKLFQNAKAFEALNTGTDAIQTTSLNVATFGSGQASTIVATVNTAEVAAGFTTFADTVGPALANTDEAEAVLGSIIIAAGAGTILAADDSASVDVNDVFTTPTTATAALTGDFSVGTWTLASDADCDTGVSSAITVLDGNVTATAAAADYTTAKFLCVAVDGTEVIPRVTTGYTITLDGALNTGITGSLGTIGYDTTSIKLDYITINSAYAQKIFLTNTSGTDAAYTTSFTLEDGSTATGGAGTVPANKMVTIKAEDFMTVTGAALRGSAVIEIEGNVGDIQATTQIINTTTKDSDTITLLVN